jgi:hypothetical protein
MGAFFIYDCGQETPALALNIGLSYVAYRLFVAVAIVAV